MFRIDAYGDMGLRVQLGKTISKETNEKIRSLALCLEKEKISGVIEWIPTYTAISISYDPYIISYDKLKNRIEDFREQMVSVKLPPAMVVHIPVCYGGEYGPDLETVAKHNGINVEDVINLHADVDYLIYMMGFTPGFPYLGGMSEKIATPRLSNPRRKIPVGSVGIAGAQTGVYSMETPGGWQLIGRTPVRLFDSSKQEPILLQAGNFVRFVTINEAEYKAIDAEIKQGIYQPKRETFLVK
ncbi:5-oxoprolinase subunit PxpB [Oceanobacillus chungangensis]|uniref:Allophanate hydrolase n=1 Tax=Oceanobacillus chungangensis TaxID=1229152 RepID=A0A3D8PJT2_9BACI|nr:5-oxoprolinase subunit PxpB [Oceanobacillus chungangensis]RDW15488.1 allophanate hydrolase [Oceanobacillus chungangensis]